MAGYADSLSWRGNHIVAYTANVEPGPAGCAAVAAFDAGPFFSDFFICLLSPPTGDVE